LTRRAHKVNSDFEMDLAEMAPTMGPLALEKARQHMGRFMDVNITLAAATAKSLASRNDLD